MATYSFSDYWRQKIYDVTGSATNLTAPTTLYLAIYSSDPTHADTGTEASGGSYARQTCALTTSGLTMENSATITFTLPAGVWTHGGIRDASTAGNLILFGQLDETATAIAGDLMTFAPGQIVWTLT